MKIKIQKCEDKSGVNLIFISENNSFAAFYIDCHIDEYDNSESQHIKLSSISNPIELETLIEEARIQFEKMYEKNHT